MGIDTRYWGPSGWDLFHRVAFHAKDKSVLKNLGEVLPCKFCRKSTLKYMRQNPQKGDAGKWLYEIHNMVNNKLRTQCAEDPKVINPGPDPSFEEVKKMYADRIMDDNFGGKFLLSIATNFENTTHKLAIQKRFLANLAKSYPKFGEYYESNPPNFTHYPEWMNGFVKGSLTEVKSFQSRCKIGKTCRKMKGGKVKTLRRS